MKKFLPIIEKSPVYPVFYDAKRTVMSLPPIINSDSTKISLNTKNVFIEITGTDLTKCQIVLAILASQFSEHCKGDSKFKIEPVEVIYEGDESKNLVSPCLDIETFEVEVSYICRLLGITVSLEDIEKAADAGVQNIALGTLLIFSDYNIFKIKQHLSNKGYKIRN